MGSSLLEFTSKNVYEGADSLIGKAGLGEEVTRVGLARDFEKVEVPVPDSLLNPQLLDVKVPHLA